MAEDILERILKQKRTEIARLGKISLADVKPSSRDLCHFIATQKKEVAVIAEIKRATPFRGALTKETLDPVKWATLYENAGAAAISVLTDDTFFHGSLADLESVAQATALPVLRKDFILDERQIYEARLWGADAVLLIVRALPEATLKHFLSVCSHVHMRALVEVHTSDEVKTALRAGANVIGINNRRLTDGVTDLEVTRTLAKEIPPEVVLVAESGIETAAHVRSLRGLVDAVLVGTSLITAAEPTKALQSLVKAGEE